MQTIPGFTADAALGAHYQTLVGKAPGLLADFEAVVLPTNGADVWPGEPDPKEVAKLGKLGPEELEKLAKEVVKPPPRPPKPGWGQWLKELVLGPPPKHPPPPPGSKFINGGRSARTRGAVHTKVLTKLVGTALLVGCEAECAIAYNDCLRQAEAAFNSDVNQCDSIRDKSLSLARKGALAESVSDIISAANQCVDAAESRFNVSAAICATNYAFCSLGCLVPF